MARRGSSARAAALRRAQQAKATRDAARLRREKDIEAALADYFEATGQAERIRPEARRKADRLLADAELAAEAPRQAASAAVHRLRELVGTRHRSGVVVRDQRRRGPGHARQAGPPAPGRHADAAEPSPAERIGGDPAHRQPTTGPVPASPPGDA